MTSRTIFAVLVLVNLALGGALAWTVQQPAVTAAVPAEEHAERVRLADEPMASAPMASAIVLAQTASEPVADPAASAPAASASAPVVEPVATPVAAEPAPPQLCLRWGDFTTSQWREARNALRLQVGGLEIEETLNDDKARYWVYMPPFDSLEAARAAIADLKAKGVADTFIIQDGGPQQLAVSLGLFSKKAMAEEFVAKLKSKGVERIISKPHPQSRYISILVRNVAESSKAALKTLATGFEKTSVQQVPCPG